LHQGLAAGDFNNGAGVSGDHIHDFFPLHEKAMGIGVSSIAIAASEVAAGKPYKEAGHASIKGLSLNAVKNFVYFKGHLLLLSIPMMNR
jgi:hypothetical protein